jgi:hypothetical protein
MKNRSLLSRRNFLKISAIGLGALFFNPGLKQNQGLSEFPNSDKLGRVCAGGEGAHFDLKQLPYSDSPSSGTVFRDDVIPWLREVVTTQINNNVINQRWVETDQGYIYSDNVQPVRNNPNQPVDLFQSTGGVTGSWVEVTVPYVDFKLQSYPALSPWLKATLKPRLYYSQIMWADQVKKDDQGQVWYRISEKYGSYGDIFWAPAEAFRLLTEGDLKPINPDASDKKIVVDLTYQELSCFEGNTEVYYCRVSSGGKFDAQGNPVDKWATPVGTHPIWRKMISTHMSGGSTGAGYDTPGIGWSSLFSNDGAAIHSTFWHNAFGVPRSHGCVNVAPDDAKWIFRWTVPWVSLATSDTTISGMNASTKVVVVEG